MQNRDRPRLDSFISGLTLWVDLKQPSTACRDLDVLEEKEKNKNKLVEVCERCGKSRSQGSLTSWIFSDKKAGCDCVTPVVASRGKTPSGSGLMKSSSGTRLEREAKLVKPDDFISNRYRIGDLIGTGGMGSVYLAHDAELKKTFAIKLLQSDLVQDPLAVKRFQQEASAVSALTHPNVVAVYDYGVSSSGNPYIIMDHIDGKGLDVIIDDQSYLDQEVVVDLFLQIADALDHAHEKGVIHRDIKPSNIMVPEGDVDSCNLKIVDFGIAKVVPDGDKTTQGITQTGELVGSPSYMSPEQCTGMSMDRRSDIYSAGCVMYEALSGMVPFQGDNPIQTILSHINDQPQSLSERFPSLSISDDLNYVVMRCLEKHPADRYQTAGELRDDLRLIKIGASPKRISPANRPKTMATPIWRSPILISSVFSILILLALSVFAINFAGIQNKAGTDISERWLTMDLAGQQAFDRGEYPLAEEKFNQSLQLAESSGKNSEYFIASLNELLDLAQATGKRAQADLLRQRIAALKDSRSMNAVLLQKELESASRADSKKSVEAIEDLVNNACDQIAVLAEAGNLDLAERLLVKARALADKNLDASSESLIRLAHNAAFIEHDRGNLEKARALYEKALAKESALLPKNHINRARTLLMLGRIDMQTGGADLEKTRARLKEALTIFRETLGPYDVMVGWTRYHLALLYYQNGRSREALSEINSALVSFQNSRPPQPVKLARAQALLAQISGDSEDFEKALGLFESRVTKDYPSMIELLSAFAEKIADSRPDYAHSLAVRALSLAGHLGESDRLRQEARLYSLLGACPFNLLVVRAG
ncbi:protein kinase [bacterium]|nr:protein kinase [bacterium]